LLLTSHDGSGCERAEQLVDHPAVAEQEQPHRHHRDAGRDVRDVVGDPQEGAGANGAVEGGGQHQGQDHGQRDVDDQELDHVQERAPYRRVGQGRLVVLQADERPGHLHPGRVKK